MSYIVTGGAGFIGSAFLATLNANGITEILVVDELGTDTKWKNLRGKRFTDYIHKDRFLELVQRDALPKGISGIIHMGACSATTEKNVDYLYANNTNYTLELARYSLEKKIRFIYASSGATYGAGELGYSDDHALISQLKPLNPYGWSKNLFDQMALERGWLTQIAGLRFFNVYGPNEYHKEDMRSVVHKAWQQVKSVGSIKLFQSDTTQFGDGEQKRDFIYVRDCCEVIWKLCQQTTVNGVFNLGTGQARSWNDLAKAVFAALGMPPKIEYIPMPGSVKGQYQNFTEAKMEKLKGTNCFVAPTSLEAGVAEYVQSFLEQGEKHL